MIVVDIETSGLDFAKNGIWQIGAVDLSTMEEFLDECRIDDEDEIQQGALDITETKEEKLRDTSKQSQKELLDKFFKWIGARKIKILICQNTQFDIGFLWTKANKYGLETTFHHRAFDLHSISHTRYFQIKGDFLIKESHSNLGLSKTLEFVGMKDERGAHNALEDAKLEAECFFRLIYGKNLLPEFSEFEVPDYLRK